jgi:outer membrane biosynthesis protein TonB
MTTAEFIIGHSADDAAERKQEARKILWALLAALFIHLLIGYSLVVFSGMFSTPFTFTEDKPVELTFVDLPTPAPATPKNTMFMETEKESAEAPKEKTFESNANSIAASQMPPTGSLPLPSQEGKDRPNIDLDSHAYSLPSEGARPKPNAAAKETPQPSVAPTPQSTPLPDQLAMLTSTPTPSVQPTAAAKPQPPKSSYRAMKQQTRQAGSITNRGPSSVNAIGTPLGRYQKMLYDAIGSRWYNYVTEKADLVSLGTADVVFSVDRSGRVKNLKVIRNSSNEAFANVCLQSILEVQLPPIPEDVASTLPVEGLEQEITFTMFPN